MSALENGCMSLRHNAKLVWRLLVRENWPAGDGDHRKLPFYLLPPLGSLFLLLLIALGGLWIVTEEHLLRERMDRVANSPYMAIFIEGYMYRSEDGREDDAHNPGYWRNMTLDAILPDFAGSPLGQTPVFESVSVYSDGFLSFLNSRNQQVSGFKGLVLDFVNPQRRNERLLDGLRKDSGGGWRWPDFQKVNGVLVSSQLMERLGYSKPWPRYLKLQQDDFGNNDAQANVPFPVVVLDQLPYRQFIIPRRIYNRLESGFYAQKVKRVRVLLFSDKATSTQVLESLRKAFPGPESTVEGLQGYGGLYSTWLNFVEPMRRMDILADFASLPRSIGQVYFDGDGEPGELSRYRGAMLYLNPHLVLKKSVQGRLIPALRKFIGQQVDQQVHGEILEVLSTTLSIQALLERISGLFTFAAIALALILALYNAVVLHSRVYRIGVLREQGASARLFVMVFAIQSLLFTLLAFSLALLIHIGFSPRGITAGQLMSTPAVYGLLGGLSLAAMVGYVAPAILYINLMEPSEMVSYRAG